MKNYLDAIEDTRKEVERSRANETQHWHYLTTPLTSTSWDGDAYSSAAKTLINLNTVFGVPAGVKAIYARVLARDSASATSSTVEFSLSNYSGAGFAQVSVKPGGLPNDYWADHTIICSCNADGNIYYAVTASGAGTMDIHLIIFGWMY